MIFWLPIMTPVPDPASCFTFSSTFAPGEALASGRGLVLLLPLLLPGLELAFRDADVDADERNGEAGAGSCGGSIASSRSRKELGEFRRTEA